ncbi:MAG: hypothetical protein HUJ25_14735 [Crocinitomicaceae bacterium]|nr:hypothetical protein [Crocinitomicaceae bacterium]
MHKKHFPYFLLVTLALFSCKKVDKLTQFEMEYDTKVTVPSSTGVNLPVNLTTPPVETNSEATFEVNDTRKDKIEQIVLTDLDITVTVPNGEDFSFLESIAVYMYAQDLPEILLASKDSIPATATKLVMDTTGEDLQEYIKKDAFTLRVKTVTDEVIATDYDLNVHQIFFVDAVVLGQ